MLANKIETLLDKDLNRGQYMSSYSVSSLTPGIYFLRIQSGNNSRTIRLIVTR